MPVDDLFPDPAPTIGAAARRDWRWYAPIWALPVVATLVMDAERAGAVPGWVATVVGLGGYTLASLAAPVPVLVERATWRQHMVLAGLTPLVTFAAFALTVNPFVIVFFGRAVRR